MTKLNDILEFASREAEHRSNQVSSTPQVERLRAAVVRMGKEHLWDGYIASQLERLPTLLDIDVGRIIGEAWRLYDELRQYRDLDPGEEAWVSLVEHDIKSRHEPRIEFHIHGTEVARLTFEVNLALHLKGLRLKVRDGCIWGLDVGACSASGEVQLEGISLVSQHSQDLPLSQIIEFDVGIPIA